MSLRDLMLEDLERGSAVFRAGHENRAGLALSPEGEVILARFDSDKPDQREHLALVPRLMAWKLATAFVGGVAPSKYLLALENSFHRRRCARTILMRSSRRYALMGRHLASRAEQYSRVLDTDIGAHCSEPPTVIPLTCLISVNLYYP